MQAEFRSNDCDNFSGFKIQVNCADSRAAGAPGCAVVEGDTGLPGPPGVSVVKPTSGPHNSDGIQVGCTSFVAWDFILLIQKWSLIGCNTQVW